MTVMITLKSTGQKVVEKDTAKTHIRRRRKQTARERQEKSEEKSLDKNDRVQSGGQTERRSHM